MADNKEQRPKKKLFNLQGFDMQSYKQTESYVQAIDALYNQAVQEFSTVAGVVNFNAAKPFSFADYPNARTKAQTIINGLAAKMEAVIKKGSRDQWLYACKKNDAFLNHILNTSKIPKKQLAKYQDRNLKALDAFQSRKINGIDLSKRIWNYTGQMKTQMELGIDIALGEGKSAAQLSRDLRQYLQDPDKLFHKVKDKHGMLHISKNAAAFHPGQGKYRSSYKNAMRLTRSEINMAYRESDQLRWQQLDFVVGYEVKLSNNHTTLINGVPTPFEDICDDLAGRYPKSFLFKGWHPQCRCHVVPIMKSDDEFDADELDALSAAWNGTNRKPFQSKNQVNDVPDNFKKWIADNAEKSQGWKSAPYFIKENFQGGTLAGGLKVAGSEPLAVVKPVISQPVPKVEPKKQTPIEKNLVEVESKIGIAKGKKMTFDEANEQKGNVNYSKAFGFRVNCQSCVVANELRRRGFDVTAQENTKKSGNIPNELSRQTEKIWIDEKTGQKPNKVKAGGIKNFNNARINSKTVKEMSKELNELTKDVGRYHIDFAWKRGRSGHIITLERLESGLVKLYDPQTGKIVRWEELSKEIKLLTGVNVLRVDNLLVNTDLINGVVMKL